MHPGWSSHLGGSARHGVQGHRNRAGHRAGGGDCHGHGHRGRCHCHDARGHSTTTHPAAARDQQDRRDAGHRRTRHRSRGRGHRLPDLRRQHLQRRRHCASDGRVTRGRGRPGGTARDPVRRAGAGSSANGDPPCDRQEPVLGRDARIRVRYRFGQDRDPDEVRDDHQTRGYCLRDHRRDRSGLFPDRQPAPSRNSDRRREARRGHRRDQRRQSR